MALEQMELEMPPAFPVKSHLVVFPRRFAAKSVEKSFSLAGNRIKYGVNSGGAIGMP